MAVISNVKIFNTLRLREIQEYMEQLDLNDIDIYRVLSSMHEGVIITDTIGQIRFFNNAQAKIDDIDPEYAIGKKIIDIYQLSDDTSPTMRCLATGQPIMNETMIYQTRLGKVANIINHVYPLFKSGKLIGAINFSKDYQLLEKTVTESSALPVKKKTSNRAHFQFSDIIGSDPDIRNAVRIARMAANSPSPVMIYGETGTGKEMFAQSIHNHSLRKKKPFIPINCAAIPENLLEGMLFGTSKGAFTGAINKRGLFELASGGTIFLDEIDSMPLGLQAKLLRVVQERKVRKLGSLKEIDLDLKILSSVGQPPMEIIQNKTLRMDLFYRIGVVSIMLPSLRERRNELNELIRYFISEYNRCLHLNVTNISKNVLALFNNHNWPGNVRELKHVIEASMNMVGKGKTIRLKHLPSHIFPSENKYIRRSDRAVDSSDSISRDLSMISFDLVKTQGLNEEKMIVNALKKYFGNAAKSAKSLGISPQSFHYKLKKYHIKRQDFFLLRKKVKKNN